MRRAIFAIAFMVIWLIVLGWAAALPWGAPITPRQQLTLDGSMFHAAIGSADSTGSGLGVSAFSEEGTALQSIDIAPIRADDFPVLRYSFSEFPRTLELSLVFRRADSAKVESISLPWPGTGTTSVDLSSLPGWHGDIVELGFAEYATAQLVPPSIAFHPFRLVNIQLWGSSWRGLPSVLRTAWFGYRPWALLSVSALGPEIDTLQTASLQPALIVGSLLSLLMAACIFGWSSWVLLRRSLLVGAVLWVALDVRWLVDLSSKHALTEHIYADKIWQERVLLVPDEDIAAMAQLVRSHIDDSSPAPTRILVASDSTYTLLRLIYFLLPLDAAPLLHALNDASGTPLPENCLLIVYASENWQYSSARGGVSSGALTIPATPVFTTPTLGMYRTQGAAR